VGKPTVLVTRKIMQEGVDLLASVFDVDYNVEDRPFSMSELIERAKSKDALVTILTDRIDEAVLSALPGLKVVANVAVGFDNIDTVAAKKHRVAVTNTPGVLTEATADFAFTLLLASARRVAEADRYVRAGKFHSWEMMGFHGGDLAGATLGIAGLGRIGQAVARRGRGFGMHVIYADEQRADAAIEAELDARYVDKETLLRSSDYLSLHVPLLPQTHHYIGESELKAMKKTAYLINSSRGPVIDEAALARGLRDGEIAGAGLDVFEREPLVDPLLLTLDNVVLAPHIASATVATRRKMAIMAAENAIAVIGGHEPPNRVA
jgi:glyoxylate reductase